METKTVEVKPGQLWMPKKPSVSFPNGRRILSVTEKSYTTVDNGGGPLDFLLAEFTLCACEATHEGPCKRADTPSPSLEGCPAVGSRWKVSASGEVYTVTKVCPSACAEHSEPHVHFAEFYGAWTALDRLKSACVWLPASPPIAPEPGRPPEVPVQPAGMTVRDHYGRIGSLQTGNHLCHLGASCPEHNPPAKPEPWRDSLPVDWWLADAPGVMRCVVRHADPALAQYRLAPDAAPAPRVQVLAREPFEFGGRQGDPISQPELVGLLSKGFGELLDEARKILERGGMVEDRTRDLEQLRTRWLGPKESR